MKQAMHFAKHLKEYGGYPLLVILTDGDVYLFYYYATYLLD